MAWSFFACFPYDGPGSRSRWSCFAWPQVGLLLDHPNTWENEKISQFAIGQFIMQNWVRKLWGPGWQFPCEIFATARLSMKQFASWSTEKEQEEHLIVQNSMSTLHFVNKAASMVFTTANNESQVSLGTIVLYIIYFLNLYYWQCCMLRRRSARGVL
jgi:hypothetical protein